VGAGEKNPSLVDFKGSDSGWRPQAFINGPGNRVYIGSVAVTASWADRLRCGMWSPASSTITRTW